MPNQNHLLIVSKDALTYKQLLENANLPQLTLHAFTKPEDARASCQTCNILLSEPHLAASLLSDMPKLEWVQSSWAGITPLLQDDLRKDYRLTGVKDIFGPLMSEYVFAYILFFERRILEHIAAQKKQDWHPVLPKQLSGKTIGILGTGSIGSHVALTAQHFGLKVKGFSQSGNAKTNLDVVYAPPHLAAFLQDTDYLVNSLPDTPDTQNLLNKSSFERMKQESIFINIGRSSIVNEDVLVNALNTQQIAAAVLDVFQVEPLPKNHPLWTSPNTYITSHTSGPSFPEAIIDIFKKNYQHFINQETLEYLVDFKKGY